MTTITIFERKNGSKPFLDWLHALNDKTIQEKILGRLVRIREHDHYGDYKPIENGIYELRFHCGKGYRVYYGKAGAMIVLLLCGGDKNTQRKDIEKAKGYWNEFKEEQRCHP